ncbi:hypothetical protein EVAR_59974_1 [Eumeta japonica]|uniref:MD-2-related lipid-recognition domain-containing protein n=1 Tax=Eumeta variegata TaxID=151549 RepID=A0A4C1YXC8_EUMVA|nr:hypothetical protein EVAR_59974_1 [Eumeta japonica]
MGGMNPDEYGPYTIKIKEYEKCKGPKRAECTSYSMTALLGPQEKKVSIEMNVSKSCVLDHCKITSKVYKGNKGKQLVNYNFDKPCQHFAIGPILTTFGNVTKNCALPQGNIKVTLDIIEQIHSFFGTNFFYGEFEFKRNSSRVSCFIKKKTITLLQAMRSRTTLYGFG